MIDTSIYTSDYIQNLTDEIRADRNLVERSLFAFGLQEALARAEMPFIFKGGTCLLLLLNDPKRLSTDIDIIVEPCIDLDEYLRKAEQIFPFKHMEENKRKGRNKIEKRHFRFYYDSPIQSNETNIILDVVFGESPYAKVIEKEIDNRFLKVSTPKIPIQVPSIDCILGDKLTAFAPYTTGIPFGVDKELEIIKQLNDIACLFNELQDYEAVRKTYLKTAEIEISFRGLDIDYKECLRDTIRACLSVMAKGTICKEDYQQFLIGIRKVKGHMIGYKYNPDDAVDQASKVLYLCSCLLSEHEFEKDIDFNEYKEVTKLPNKLKSLFYIKRFNFSAFGYLCKSLELISLEELI